MKTALEQELEMLQLIAETQQTIVSVIEHFDISRGTFFNRVKSLRHSGADIVAAKKTGQLTVQNWPEIKDLCISWLRLERSRDFRMGFAAQDRDR